MIKNEMSLSFSALSQNEAFARVCVAAFAAQLNPTVSDITEIKTAVSEAVTNAIIHGYEGKAGNEGNAVYENGAGNEEVGGFVNLHCEIAGRTVYIEVSDQGKGIDDIQQAREPLYTSKPEMERSGMGFTVMEEFMDSVDVQSAPGSGTRISMTKTLA